MTSPLGELPYYPFLSSVIFGAEKSRELLDYFVNVGPLSSVDRP